MYLQNADCVAQLLNAKIDPSIRNYEDYTALHIAFWNQNQPIQQLILDSGGLLQTETTFEYYDEVEPKVEVNLEDTTDVMAMAKFFKK